MDATNLFGLPSGIGPTGTPIASRFSIVFMNALVEEYPANALDANKSGRGISPPTCSIFALEAFTAKLSNLNSSSRHDLHSLKFRIELRVPPIKAIIAKIVFVILFLFSETISEFINLVNFIISSVKYLNTLLTSCAKSLEINSM